MQTFILLQDHFNVWHHFKGTFLNNQQKSDHVCVIKLTIIIIIIVASDMFGNFDPSMVGVVSLHNVFHIFLLITTRRLNYRGRGT